MGTPEIASQVEQCGSKVHLFGHSHYNIDLYLNNTRFVQNALGHVNDRPHDTTYIVNYKPILLWDSHAKAKLSSKQIAKLSLRNKRRSSVA